MRVWLNGQQLWATHAASGWSAGDEVAARLLIGGVQVVGSRAPGVPVPAGGATVDAEARSAIALIIDRLIHHGLIEP
jgi:hypothetical protein